MHLHKSKRIYLVCSRGNSGAKAVVVADDDKEAERIVRHLTTARLEISPFGIPDAAIPKSFVVLETFTSESQQAPCTR